MRCDGIMHRTEVVEHRLHVLPKPLEAELDVRELGRGVHQNFPVVLQQTAIQASCASPRCHARRRKVQHDLSDGAEQREG